MRGARLVDRMARPGVRLVVTLMFLSGIAPRGSGEPAPVMAGNRSILVCFNNNYGGTVEENHRVAMSDPFNTDKYLLAVIAGATATLDAAFYDVSDEQVAQAFIDAAARGVSVRLLTDNDNVLDKETGTVVRPGLLAMERAGVDIRNDQRSALMHHKFMVVDGRVVWVSSMNLTTTSMYDHNNNGNVIRSEKVAANFTAEFDRLFGGGALGGPRMPVPFPSVRVGRATVETYFSPRGGIRDAIIKEIRGARRSIRFMAFVYTDEQIAQAMIEGAARGVKVEGVVDECLLAVHSQYRTLRRAGIPVRWDGNQALMHHKVLIIDDETVITGSYNFTLNAEENNNEAMLVIRSVPLAARYIEEYERVRKATFLNRDLPPYDHPACSGGERL